MKIRLALLITFEATNHQPSLKIGYRHWRMDFQQKWLGNITLSTRAGDPVMMPGRIRAAADLAFKTR